MTSGALLLSGGELNWSISAWRLPVPTTVPSSRVQRMFRRPAMSLSPEDALEEE
jgi:hypothetical protein